MVLDIYKDSAGFYVRFDVKPARFYTQWFVRLLFWTGLQALGYFALQRLRANSFLLLQNIALGLLTLLLIRAPTIDSLYVFKSYGIQLSTTQGCLLLPEFLNERLFEVKTFIPSDDLVAMVINEGFEGLAVVFYMCIIAKRSRQLKIVFPVCSVVEQYMLNASY
ncbi:ADL220Cp [Eremothecium gossypii ATCC 10895]|uniref:ADL220Cp n=1 Tax=Eremothecium gossypii (strain ATCC 10895 / CBS 109.51 / FGSC 9923 / NRRL Y-1056) TaxID=284811 RepID=Q75AZ0_EREGS|nr:ADL220Cp [Eremothecium gossypii ATCC 10895]AAS51700.1 ADL220Cp [Eremothecium gossypii ATCC 10895]AEY95997.1 FADL220Cp [Eremothecium gossypii FDAG1]